MIITSTNKESFLEIGRTSRLDIKFQYGVNLTENRCNVYLNVDVVDIISFWENKNHMISWSTLPIALNKLYAYLKRQLLTSDIKQAIYGNHSCGYCQIILPKELLKIYHKEDYSDSDRRLDITDEKDMYIKPYLFSVLEMFMQRFAYSIYSKYKDLIWYNIKSNNYQCCDLSLVKLQVLSSIEKYIDDSFVCDTKDFRDDTGFAVFNEGLLPIFHELLRLSFLDKLELDDVGMYHENVSTYAGKDFDLIK